MPTLDKIGSWTRQSAIDKLKWTIEEKYKMSEEEMLRTMNKKWLVENGFETPLHYLWEDVVFCMLEDVYPNRYMPWDYTKTPNGFWTEETTIIYFRWLVFDKYQYTKEQFLQIYGWDWVQKKTKLSASIERRWDNDLQKILADAFPEWVADSVILRKAKKGKRLPGGYWTKERTFEMLDAIVKEEGMDRDDIVNTINSAWLQSRSLRSPLQNIWGGKVRNLLEDWKPGEYKIWEFNRVPAGFWTKETATQYLKWLVLDKNRYTKEEFIETFDSFWLNGTKLVGKYHKIWDNGLYGMVKDVFPDWADDYKTFRNLKNVKNLKKISNEPEVCWTVGKVFNILDNIVKEEGMSRDDIVKAIKITWLRDKGLYKPLITFWGGSTFSLVNDWKPGEYKPWEFNKVPAGYWTKETVIEYIRWLVLDKKKYTKEEFVAVYNSEWLKKTRIRDTYLTIWVNGVEGMFTEAFPEWINS